MKKVGILSMQRVPNFGSLLQSYSLKKMLEELDAEVHFIDIEKNDRDNAVVKEFSAVSTSEMEANHGFLSKLKKIDRYVWNRFRIRKIADKQDAFFEKFRNESLQMNDSDNELSYDLCVIGSDEVFNCMTPSSWGFTSQLFGNVRQANDVITYAASCGATTYEQLNPEMIKIIKKAFQNVSGFSVRDENTKNFISQLTDQPIEESLDPVWVGDFDSEVEAAKVTVELPEHYCIVYSYYNRIHNKDEIQAIQEFCKEKKLVPIAIGAPQVWVKNYVAVSPFEMFKIFQNAEFIITDTFHGTIFSEKFNGRYAVLLRESNKNKLGDLVRKINAEDHVIPDFNHLNDAYIVFSDRENSKQRQVEDRKKSLDYLKQYM
ncbi:polysaccharide pyruvyl transferase family protein [Blautia hansenii]|uniref:polysaccharide pyruvyl transferase family protein n=1 Tax=Blautia hansenii TaxID=1322 RepID=UPI0022E76BBB|nr:polysaccharide pyruvyl transferase family protein [Blautia hansenii]